MIAPQDTFDLKPPTGPLPEFIGRSISTAARLDEARVYTGIARGWSRAETAWFAGSTAKRRKKAAEALDALLARKPQLKTDILNQLKQIQLVALDRLSTQLESDRVSPDSLIRIIEKFTIIIERLCGTTKQEGESSEAIFGRILQGFQS